MSKQDRILQMLIEEFSRDGFECFEFKGQHFARISVEDRSIEMTDVCLSRLAEQIARRLP